MNGPSRPRRAPAPTERGEVGRVAALSARGTLTVRATTAVPEGTSLTDEEERFHGRVVRVFGPVAHPYLSVASRRPLKAEEALALLGAPLLREVRRPHG